MTDIENVSNSISLLLKKHDEIDNFNLEIRWDKNSNKKIIETILIQIKNAILNYYELKSLKLFQKPICNLTNLELKKINERKHLIFIARKIIKPSLPKKL